jgi:hypothetical protein
MRIFVPAVSAFLREAGSPSLGGRIGWKRWVEARTRNPHCGPYSCDIDRDCLLPAKKRSTAAGGSAGRAWASCKNSLYFRTETLMGCAPWLRDPECGWVQCPSDGRLWVDCGMVAFERRSDDSRHSPHACSRVRGRGRDERDGLIKANGTSNRAVECMRPIRLRRLRQDYSYL